VQDLCLLLERHCLCVRNKLLAKEGALERKRVHDAVLAENDDACSRLLAFFNSESTIFKAKERILLAAHQRDDPQLGVLHSPIKLIVLVAASIKEGVLFARVAMQVTVEHHSSLLVHVAD